MSAAQLTEEQVPNWTEYVLKIRCARCGEEIFGCEEEARDVVEFVANHFDLGPADAATDWRLIWHARRLACGAPFETITPQREFKYPTRHVSCTKAKGAKVSRHSRADLRRVRQKLQGQARRRAIRLGDVPPKQP